MKNKIKQGNDLPQSLAPLFPYPSTIHKVKKYSQDKASENLLLVLIPYRSNEIREALFI